MNRFKILAPATTANLGPGFDVIGLALDWWNEVTIESATVTSLEVEGKGADDLPRDASNLFLKTVNWYFQRKGMRPVELLIRQVNNIPMASGLGSSSAAIVSGLLAAATIEGKALEREELFTLAVELEGHPDNVAAAMFGGITIAYSFGESPAAYRLDPSPELMALVLHPSKVLSTEESRGVLAKEVTREDAVFNLSRVPLLVEALRTGDEEMLTVAMEDRLHQPERMALIPELGGALDCLKELGVAGALSGAGPSVISIFRREKEAALAHEIGPALHSRGLHFEPYFVNLSLKGAFEEKQN